MNQTQHKLEPKCKLAIASWSSSLGAGRVLTGNDVLDRYTRNVTGLERTVVAVLKPRTTAEVVDIVKTANATGVPLYPISRGCNWGMGSKLPVSDGAAVVDLSGLCQIREVNVRDHYAVVEAGVTQEQLYRHISEQDLPLVLNVIGSGTGTSLIGNSLERGIGYFDSRADSLCALEVVLGNGKVINTGFSHFANNKVASLYRHGVGPGLDDLFAQSNYGIVTSATVELMPKPECQVAMLASIADESKLSDLIDALADLRRDGVIQTIAHIGNRARCDVTLVPLICEELAKGSGATPFEHREAAAELLQKCGFKAWSCVVGLTGCHAQLKVSKRLIRKRLRGISRPKFVTERTVRLLQKITSALSFLPYFKDLNAFVESQIPLFGLTAGIPTDIALKSVHWGSGTYERDGQLTDLDMSESGYAIYLPLTPLSGAHAERAMEILNSVFGEYGFVPYTTMNIINTRTLEHVINLSFDLKDEEQTRRAHDCIRALDRSFRSEGYLPYRVGIQLMQDLVDPADSFWQTARDLKKVLDPNNIISPGRYNLI